MNTFVRVWAAYGLFMEIIIGNKQNFMMRLVTKLLFLATFLWISSVSGAQEVQKRIGYLSYNAIFQAMPEYEASRQRLNDLKAKYDKEARRSEEEFQRKFVEFMQGQKDFPENILQKRQYELQDLLVRSIQFKDEAEKLLAQAEKELQADMLYLLNVAIRAVGMERGYSYILNTDGNACPFIHPEEGEDVTNYVKEKLQLPIDIE